MDLVVNDPKDVSVFSNSDPMMPKSAPPFTIMTLSLKTVMNHKQHVNEVVSASMLVHSNGTHRVFLYLDEHVPLICTLISQY